MLAAYDERGKVYGMQCYMIVDLSLENHSVFVSLVTESPMYVNKDGNVRQRRQCRWQEIFKGNF